MPDKKKTLIKGLSEGTVEIIKTIPDLVILIEEVRAYYTSVVGI